MAGKKFFSDDDIEAARLALSELPDLTAKHCMIFCPQSGMTSSSWSGRKVTPLPTSEAH